ncbi:MAG: radical SAM protein [Nanoarchaeota archaeon]|nr:radical SAM protein [Nanoarchaeota archaeon]
MSNKIKEWIYDFAANKYLKKPEQKEFIKTRYPTFKSIYDVGLNQFFYMCNSTYSPKVTSVQFEVTNNCNLSCKMCPVNNGMKRKKGFMKYELFKKIVDENPKMEFALMFNWGEPLLHPKIYDMLDYANKKGIRTFLTTNAVLLTNDKKMKKLLNAKIERITISLDGFEDSYTKIRGFDYKIIEKRIMRLIELRNELKIKTKIDINMVIMPETEKHVPQFYKKWKDVVDRIQIQPNISFTPRKRNSRCKELWRGNIIVLWDGKVVPCCVDYEGKMVLGDANKTSLKKIWNSRMSKRWREMHNKKIFPLICRNCNEYSSEYITPRFE